MNSYKFFDTKRFSPVIYEGDLPWEEDLYHIPAEMINREYLESSDHITDEEWWQIQYDRCMNGYEVPNALVPGGDMFTDKLMSVYVEHEGESDTFFWGNNIIVNGDSICFKDINITVKNGLVRIPGRMYFYLNFWKIHRKTDDGLRKKILNPKFTDLSFLNWWIRERFRKERKDHLWSKARQRGYSEEEACDTAYEYLFYPDSQSVIVSGEDKYNENTMKMVKTGLSYMANTQFYKDYARGGDSMSYIKSKNTGSEVYSRTCKNNYQVLSGLTPGKVHYEEIGIWEKGAVQAVSETVDPSLEAEGTKLGFKVYTGTGGDVEDGVADIEAMAWNPEEHGLLEFDYEWESEGEPVRTAFFCPSFYFKLVDEDYNSRCRESIESIYKYQMSATGDKRYIRVVMNPLRLSDIFKSKEGGYFGKDVSQYCNERKAYIKTHREAQVVKRYRAELKDPKSLFAGIEMVYDEEGPFLIAELPERDKDGKVYDNLYRAGTDSYDKDEAAYSNSKGACWIKKGFLNANRTYNKYVAGLVERPNIAEGGREVFYKNTVILSIFYNAINLIEYSNILIIDWYVKNGYSSVLKMRPEFVTANIVINSKMNNKFGIDPSTKPHWLLMQKDYLRNRENIEKCDFVELLDAWSKFRYDPSGKKYNCDITIATSLCTVCEEDEKFMEVEESSKESFSSLRYERDRNGNLKVVI